MTNSHARAVLLGMNVTSENVTKEEIKVLRKMLRKEFKKDGIFTLDKETKNFKYLTMSSEYFKKRECISFNKDGFIGFAGWASTKNTAPILEVVCEWARVIKNWKGLKNDKK